MQTLRFVAILMAAAAEMAAAEVAGGDAPTRRLIVNMPARRMALVVDGKVVKIYPVAVGKKSTPSPSGVFHIASHVANPSYTHEGKVIRPGAGNPVGTRWMSLGYKGYGVHGTNQPESIGHASSHGCIRLRNHDVEELFEMVRVGDEVDMVANPTPEEAKLFEPAAPQQKITGEHLQAQIAAADGIAEGLQ